MATYSHGYEDNLKRAIRDAVAIDPIATIPQLTETLSKRLNHSFDPRYIKKLRDKVNRQALIEYDRTKIEDRIAQTRNNYRIVREQLLKILYWSPATAEAGMPKPLARDRVEAAKTLVMLDLAVFKAELETGMFKKPVEDLAQEIRYAPLPDEARAVIIASWKRGGLLPAAAIEHLVPAAAVEERS